MRRILYPLAIGCICAVPATVSAQAAPFLAGEALSSRELGGIAGKADTNLEVRAQNSSTVSNNSISGPSQTGTISFDAQAFQHMSGLALLSANTGNNVSINASLNVNVAVRP
jgi:hypothetical protein